MTHCSHCLRLLRSLRHFWLRQKQGAFCPLDPLSPSDGPLRGDQRGKPLWKPRRQACLFDRLSSDRPLSAAYCLRQAALRCLRCVAQRMWARASALRASFSAHRVGLAVPHPGLLERPCCQAGLARQQSWLTSLAKQVLLQDVRARPGIWQADSSGSPFLRSSRPFGPSLGYVRTAFGLQPLFLHLIASKLALRRDEKDGSGLGLRRFAYGCLVRRLRPPDSLRLANRLRGLSELRLPLLRKLSRVDGSASIGHSASGFTTAFGPLPSAAKASVQLSPSARPNCPGPMAGGHLDNLSDVVRRLAPQALPRRWAPPPSEASRTTYGAGGATPPSAAPQETSGRRSPSAANAASGRCPEGAFGVQGQSPWPIGPSGRTKQELRSCEDVPRGVWVRSPTTRSLAGASLLLVRSP